MRHFKVPTIYAFKELMAYNGYKIKNIKGFGHLLPFGVLFDKYHSIQFVIVSEIEKIETIPTGGRIHDIMRIQRQFGCARWRKLKGIEMVRLQLGTVRKAELHWYEAHDVGRKKMKIKKDIDHGMYGE